MTSLTNRILNNVFFGIMLIGLIGASVFCTYIISYSSPRFKEGECFQLIEKADESWEKDYLSNKYVILSVGKEHYLYRQLDSSIQQSVLFARVDDLYTKVSCY